MACLAAGLWLCCACRPAPAPPSRSPRVPVTAATAVERTVPLQIARIGSKLPIDENLASEIEAALASIEHRQDVQRAEVELSNGQFANDFIPVNQRTRASTNPLDLNEIRTYFQANNK